MEPVRIAVAGLGTHAWRGHIDHACGLFDVVAACDPDMARAATLRDAAIHGDYGTMLAHPGVEAVLVMSPDRFHAAQALAALEAGKHVFCEKPMACSETDMPLLRRALDVSAGRGLVLSSCHPRRFDPPFSWLRDNLPRFRQALGEPVRFDFDFFYNAPAEGKGGLHSGLLIDHVPHEVDTMSMLFGRRPFKARRLADSQVSYAVAGVRDDGLQFMFSGTRMLSNGRYPETAAVRFQRGTVRIDASTGMAEVVDHESGGGRTEPCGSTDYDGRFRAVNLDFARAVRGLSPSYLEPGDLLLNTASSIALSEGGVWDGSGPGSP